MAVSKTIDAFAARAIPVTVKVALAFRRIASGAVGEAGHRHALAVKLSIDIAAELRKRGAGEAAALAAILRVNIAVIVQAAVAAFQQTGASLSMMRRAIESR